LISDGHVQSERQLKHSVVPLADHKFGSPGSSNKDATGNKILAIFWRDLDVWYQYMKTRGRRLSLTSVPSLLALAAWFTVESQCEHA